MKLFIDTNIFLNFYHLTKDDLEELRKLVVLIDENAVTLYLPMQIISEFRRNRDVKLADAIKKFKQENMNNQFPQICKEYPEYRAMKSSIQSYNKAKSKLLEKILSDIQGVKLKADKLIEDLFAKATTIDFSGKIIRLAKLRYDLGNPPGKKRSYGDAINWVSLLTEVPNRSDLYFISEDTDYLSNLNPDEFSPFLLGEWKAKKKGKIIFYKRLSAFFKDKFPHIKVANQLEKELLIQRLSASRNFAETRLVIGKLHKFFDFTDSEVKSIVEASNSNNQIYWIMQDDDINKHLCEIISGHEDKLDIDALDRFKKNLGEEESIGDAGVVEPDDEIPF